MSIEIEGTVYKILPETSGQSANGSWVKQEFILETKGEYPKKVCFNCWGDKVQAIKGLTIGEKIKVSFEPSSREFNDKWYTDLRAWKIEKAGSGTASTTSTSTSQQTQSKVTPPDFSDVPPPTIEDDLPF